MNKTVLGLIMLLIAFSFSAGCASMTWVLPEEFKESRMALEKARQSGAADRCPEAFQQAQEMYDYSVDIFWSCQQEDAVPATIAAKRMAERLCHPPCLDMSDEEALGQGD